MYLNIFCNLQFEKNRIHLKPIQKSYNIILLLISMNFLLPVEAGEYSLVKSIAFPQQVEMTTDNLGNAYVIVENQLLQFDLNGKPKANFNENNLGSLYFADAGNPMKILLFYRDFARVLILDSKLSLQSLIDLRALKINQPLSVCNSEENGYWVYDREDDQLKKLDNSLQVIQKSDNLTQILGYQMLPGMMSEDNGFVYINNPATGILVFDRYGAYYKTIPFPGLKSFQIIEKEILFVSNKKLYRYGLKTLKQDEVLLPKNDSIRSARIEQHQLYLLTNDSLSFYYF